MATARDAGMTSDVLARAGLQVLACENMPRLVCELTRGAAALVVAEETLARPDLQTLADALATQPPWSDMAALVLSRQGADSDAVGRAMERLPNVAIIERPVRVASLVSAVRSALRARRRQYEVRALLEDLRQADQRKTEFLATLAHELRNPLAPLRTTLALLSGPTPEPVATNRYHALMRRQVDHMVRLVDDLMEVSRITRGKVDLQFVPVLLDAVIRDAIEQSRPGVEAAGHSLAVDTGNDTLLVSGDAVRLTQVFSNLLNNAAKYTPAGGKVRVTARREGASAVVDVTDSGVGLAPEMLKSVFEMFVQVSGTSKAAQGGLGIGLTLAQSLVELHGGTVRASSPGLDRGATFTVLLPLARDAGDAGEPETGLANWRTTRLPRIVLVVDDNRDAADSLVELLGAMGATAFAAYSGEEGLRLAAARDIELAVLDIGMPGMDGYELARQLRAMPRGAELMLIALTGWGQDRDRQRLAAAGFDHHLLKPVDADHLAALLGAGLARAAPDH
jgi:signal transduction histidine kinase/ActR/RegA family two-component response regulator